MNSSTNIPKIEEDVLKFWQENKVFEQSLEKTKSSKPFVFYDGPPFATGLPHHGHLLASTIKDIVGRYQTMQGYYVERRFGWDCHGLPIEYEIDKQFGKSTQDLVKEMGIKGYNEACRSIVQRYVKEWYKTVSRLGRWVDMDNDYKTMDKNFMESVWWVFSELWRKGLVYEGTKVVPYSTALATGLSNFEAGSNYQMRQDPAVTLLIKCKHMPVYLSIWTTTPWTLPSNLGVCVNPDLTYVQVHDKQRNLDWILVKDRFEFYASRHDLEIVKSFPGRDLLGLQYEPIFPYFADLSTQGAFVVVGDSYVSADDGTGLVHMAPAHGEDDHRILKQNDMTAIVCPLDENGCYTEEVVDFKGQYVKDADSEIILYLKNNNMLLQHDTCDHSYPCCPRSDTPLIYRTMPSWFIKVESIKSEMLEMNEQINWVPEHIKDGRFGKWVAQARDWAVSRNRVWGTPIPIWRNDTTNACYCIGSIAELTKLTGIEVNDLHRDYIDDLSFSLPGEEGVYRRIPEVLDCWFESGSMPYAQQHYPFENKKIFEDSFPANFIAEGLDQTRGWFYTLTVLSTALFSKPAFKNIIVQGIVLAEDGKKMSKRLKNYTAPDELMDKFGADALRLYLINSGLVKGDEQRFSDVGVRDITRKVLLPWLNAVKFWVTYAQADSWTVVDKVDSTNILDRWILSKLQTLKNNINSHMQNYHLYQVVPELFDFIDILTNIYIRLNRHRFWSEGYDAYSVLYQVLKEFSACMAPFAPFMAEYAYQTLIKQANDSCAVSVHLLDFPKSDISLQDLELESLVNLMQSVIVLGRQVRNDSKIKVKVPLQKLTIVHSDIGFMPSIGCILDIIRRELNVKEVILDSNEDNFVKLYALPNSPVLGKRFGSEFSHIAKFIKSLSPSKLRKFELDGLMVYQDHTFSRGDILLKREAVKPGVVGDGNISILLDLELTPDLVQEGLARELISRIQQARKDLDLHVSDRIRVYYDGSPEILDVIALHNNFIKGEVLAIELKHEKNVEFRDSLQLNGLDFSYAIDK